MVPFIFSLKVALNESPTSVKSVVRRLLTMRASVIVGGVKSPAPVVTALFGSARSYKRSWIGPQRLVVVTRRAAAGRAELGSR